MSSSNSYQQPEMALKEEPEQLVAFPASAVWTDPKHRSLIICLTAATIQEGMAAAADDQERGILKRFFAVVSEYARPRLLCNEKDNLDVLEEITATIKRIVLVQPRPPEQDHIRRGRDHLLAIVDELTGTRALPCLGTPDQKPKNVDHHFRYICVFDHQLFTRVSDLRGHLIENHTRKVADGCCLQMEKMDQREVKILTGQCSLGESRLRVFGPYTYNDVLANGWNIKNWNEREPRRTRTTGAPSLRSKATRSSKPASKRKDRQGSYEESDERYTRNGPPPTAIAQPPHTPTSTTRSRNTRPSLSSQYQSSSSTMPTTANSRSRPVDTNLIDPRLRTPTLPPPKRSGQDLVGMQMQPEFLASSHYPDKLDMNLTESSHPPIRVLFPPDEGETIQWERV